MGNIYCGHCGGRLTLTTSGRKRVRKDGTVIRETRAKYQCHYNIRHPGECDGQSGYGVEKLDKLVDQIIRIQLGRIRSAPSQELIAKQQAMMMGERIATMTQPTAFRAFSLFRTAAAAFANIARVAGSAKAHSSHSWILALCSSEIQLLPVLRQLRRCCSGEVIPDSLRPGQELLIISAFFQ